MTAATRTRVTRRPRRNTTRHIPTIANAATPTDIPLLLSEIRRLKELKIACAWCGTVVTNDSEVLEHILTCEKRPESMWGQALARAVTDIERVECLFRTANAAKREACKEIERIKECVHMYYRVDEYTLAQLLYEVFGSEADKVVSARGYMTVGDEE